MVIYIWYVFIIDDYKYAMDTDFLSKIKKLLEEIFIAEQNFYRDKYSSFGFDEIFLKNFNESSFKSLPILTQNELAQVPYKSRTYKEGEGLNKLIHSESADTYFLIHRLLDEISEDQLPYYGSRPIMLFSNMYEAIERCLFFYSKGILPLIGEVNNPSVIFATAKNYDVDMIFTDHASCESFKEGLINLSLPVKNVAIIDTLFQSEDLVWPEEIKVDFIWNIPEVGRIAYACPEFLLKKEKIFHAYDDVHIEAAISAIITSSRLQASPIIRYQTNIGIEESRQKCSCGKKSFSIPIL